MTNIAKNIAVLTTKIRECEQRYHRPAQSVKLIAASKTQSIEKIQQAIAAGQLAFGENYLQEAIKKIQALNNPLIEWHFIGLLQSNKAKKIAQHFSWVHTVDNDKIAQRLNDYRPASLPPLNICLEINTSGEKTKVGIHPDEALQLAEFCTALPRLKLRGLMTMPALKKSFAEQCDELRKLRSIYDVLNKKDFHLDTLSMGTTNDLEAAIEEGATMVRIGTALFGNRD